MLGPMASGRGVVFMICGGLRIVVLGQDELRCEVVFEAVELRNVVDRRVSWLCCRGLLMVSKDVLNT
jgi:hypothetical protein